MDCMVNKNKQCSLLLKKETLGTHKECLYHHQPPLQRKMSEQKEHIYNSMSHVIVKK